ncbi:hypothetical protein ACWEPC_17695 [Nonomuraea sp. NPDC004297]
MASLDRKRETMRRIFRGQENYGDGTAAEQAARYRMAEMYEDVIKAAHANSEGVECPKVDLLISLSGFSPETTLLAYELVQPPRLLVISSENTRGKMDQIFEKLRGRIAFSQFEQRYCDPVDPVGIYDIVHKAVRPSVPGGSQLRAIIDITGGKKVMSAGAALAASQLDLPLCYIDSVFDPEMRQAVPGTERLCILPNPTALFGDKEMAAAMAMFGSGLYSGAALRFTELSDSMSEPARARFLGDLSQLYQAWCDLDSGRLPDLVARLRNRLSDPRSGVRTETIRRLADQLDFITALAAKDGSALLLNFFLLGRHYQDQHRYDFAALLYYRTIEKSLSERLKLRYSGFNTKKPDYALLYPDQDTLASRYGRAAKRAYRSPHPLPLPRDVALVDAVLLLHVLEDELLPAAQIIDFNGIGYIRTLVEGRNDSVLAHGEKSVDTKQCEDLHARALVNLRAFWRLHHTEENVDERIDILRFVTEV